MDADVGEVSPEAGFHVRAGGVVQGPAGGAQDVVDGGALHGGLCGALVAATVTVLVLVAGQMMAGLPEHLDHGCVARRTLQREQSLRS